MSSNVKEQPGFFARVGRYFRDVSGEMKKVVWPSRKQVINNTGIVIAFMALMAVVVGVLDLGMSVMLKLLFGS